MPRNCCSTRDTMSQSPNMAGGGQLDRKETAMCDAPPPPLLRSPLLVSGQDSRGGNVANSRRSRTSIQCTPARARCPQLWAPTKDCGGGSVRGGNARPRRMLRSESDTRPEGRLRLARQQNGKQQGATMDGCTCLHRPSMDVPLQRCTHQALEVEGLRPVARHPCWVHPHPPQNSDGAPPPVKGAHHFRGGLQPRCTARYVPPPPRDPKGQDGT